MDNRQYQGESYLFGFQGMEQEPDQDEEQYHTLFRQYDAVLGRWWSSDPEQMQFPSFSPYLAMNANPVNVIDPDGRKGRLPRIPRIRAHHSTNINHNVRPYTQTYTRNRPPKSSAPSGPHETRPSYTFPPSVIYAEEGYVGTINRASRSSRAPVQGEGMFLGLNLFHESVSSSGSLNLDIAIQKNVTKNGTFYTPFPADGNIKNEDYQTLNELETKYQNDLNKEIQTNLAENGVEEFDSEGNLIPGAHSENQLIVASTKAAFKIKYGRSPMEQFETWAKKQVESGTMVEGEKQYEATISETPSQQP